MNTTTGAPPSAFAPKNIPPNESRVTPYAVVSCVFYTLALVIFVLRIYDRRRRNNLALEDLFIAIAVFTLTGQFIFNMLAITYGVGHHFYYVSAENGAKLGKISLLGDEMYIYTVTFAKLSIATMLKRFMTDVKAWRYGLNILMVTSVIEAIVSSCISFTQCIPIKAIWDFTYPESACANRQRLLPWAYLSSVLFLLTDFILALLPIILIRRLRRPLREKIFIGFLMGLGLLCSAAIIPKLFKLGGLSKDMDFTWSIVDLFTWATLECCIGVIVACLPTLKNMFENFLVRTGLLTITDPSSEYEHNLSGETEISLPEKETFDISNEQRTLG